MLQLVAAKHRKSRAQSCGVVFLWVSYQQRRRHPGAGCGVLCHAGCHLGLSWAKAFSPAFQQLPRKCSRFYQAGKHSTNCIISINCIIVRPGTGMERASCRWGSQEGKEPEGGPAQSPAHPFAKHFHLGTLACPTQRVSPRQSGKF